MISPKKKVKHRNQTPGGVEQQKRDLDQTWKVFAILTNLHISRGVVGFQSVFFFCRVPSTLWWVDVSWKMGQEATQILEEATHFPHFRPASWRSTGRGSYNFFFTGMAWIFYVHPGNLTCRYQKLPLFKGSYLFQTIILGIHVSFQGCKYLENIHPRPMDPSWGR